MRIVRWFLATLTVCICIGAGSAAAANGPAWPVHVRTTTPVKAAPPLPVVVLTLAKLPQYPWVQPLLRGRVRHGVAVSPGWGAQPVWLKTGSLTLPKLAR